jgi:OPT family oligopeptide transporter
LPWWGVLFAIALSIISIIPIGTIEAISGQRIGINVIAEMVIGYVLPGRIVSVMTFKTFCYLGIFHALELVADLKFAQYLKIPPRAMFITQLMSSIISFLIDISVSSFIYERIGAEAMASNTLGWNASAYKIFISAGAIWGAIGPARFFGKDSPYHLLVWGFAIGLILPLIPYIMHRFFPKGWWSLINIPIMAVLPVGSGSMRSDLITPFVIAFIVNVILRKYRHEWWRKYAYVMSSAFDTGAALAITVILLMMAVNPDFSIMMPFYSLNPFDGEHCVPEYYNEVGIGCLHTSQCCFGF